MILIERYQPPRILDTSTFSEPNLSEVTREGQWQRAWLGVSVDEEAREIIDMCEANGDPWRVTSHAERVQA